MRALALLIAALLFAGCYDHHPLLTPRPAEGTRVRVTLTDSGTTALARYIGRDAASVDGAYLGSNNGEGDLRLAVTAVKLRSGDENFWKGEVVTLPRFAVATVQERKLNRSKTALMTAGFIAILAGVYVGTDGLGYGLGAGGRGTQRPD